MSTHNWIDINILGYSESYITLMLKHEEYAAELDSYSTPYYMPAYTIAAFACELAIKSILEKMDNRNGVTRQIRGHKLDALFNMLEDDVKKKIIEKTIVYYNIGSKHYGSTAILDETEFNNQIIKETNVFAEMRYFHELGSMSISTHFIEAFMFALTCDVKRFSKFVSQVVKLSNNDESKKKLVNEICKIIVNNRNTATDLAEDVYNNNVEVLKGEIKFIESYSPYELKRYKSQLEELIEYNNDELLEAKRIIENDEDLSYKYKDLDFINDGYL